MNKLFRLFKVFKHAIQSDRDFKKKFQITSWITVNALINLGFWMWFFHTGFKHPYLLIFLCTSFGAGVTSFISACLMGGTLSLFEYLEGIYNRWNLDLQEKERKEAKAIKEQQDYEARMNALQDQVNKPTSPKIVDEHPDLGGCHVPGVDVTW